MKERLEWQDKRWRERRDNGKEEDEDRIIFLGIEREKKGKKGQRKVEG